MSAVRDLATRWSDAERTPVPLSARPWIALALVCPAIFVCFFLVGRSTIPASAPHATVATSLPITYGGAAIPAHLGSAPAIEAIAAAQTLRGGSSRASSTSTTQPLQAAAPTPASTTQPQASSSPAPTSTSTPAAPSTPTPARHAQPKKGGRVSFDTSG